MYEEFILTSNEEDRLKALESYRILDTLGEDQFESVVGIAAQICGTPLSMINLIDRDRQWSKAAHGIQINTADRESSFCTHTIRGESPLMIVPDTLRDNRFNKNAYVINAPNLRFYAGAKLATPEGLPLGALCVLDTEPRDLNNAQKTALQDLAKLVMQLMEDRKNDLQQQETIAKLSRSNKELRQFAIQVAHDIRSPLNNIHSLTQLFSDKYGAADEDGTQILDIITSASQNLRGLVDGLLQNTLAEQYGPPKRKPLEMEGFIHRIREYFSAETRLELNYSSQVDVLFINKTALEQILLNLIGNSLKHSNKEHVFVSIEVWEEDSRYCFRFSDNGPGIPEERREAVFEYLNSFGKSGTQDEKSYGIGLATVRKLVGEYGGSIELVYGNGTGACFKFRLDKDDGDSPQTANN